MGKSFANSDNILAGLSLLLLAAAAPVAVVGQGTRFGFYSTSGACPRAEAIVRSTVQAHYRADNGIAAAILRMHFHDCFVQGCDGSVLISGPSAERNALPNLALRGYDVIDDAKARLEAACPGVVSCADVLALAARDAVNLAGGPSWEVPTGRRDGLVSSSTDANNLPSFTDSIDVQKQKFAQMGLTTRDLVTLVGAHTIGTAQCQFFRYRLYNFTSAGGADPAIDPGFVSTMRALCPADGDGTKRVALDYGGGVAFDTSFFANVDNGRAMLESDQRLLADPGTKRYIDAYTGLIGGLLGAFESEFVTSMVKMSNIGVLTGRLGEIRKVCSSFNS